MGVAEEAEGGFEAFVEGIALELTGGEHVLTRDSYNGALADLHLGTDPYTGNRYALGAGNPITGVELDGHLTGAACGPDITCGMTDFDTSVS